MATRKYNGPKHHSRRYQSNDNNRRRLSKQEEIDLTLDGIDLKEETLDNNDKCNKNNTIVNNNETTVTPITIHVEDRCDAKPLVENEKCENSQISDDRVIANSEISTMHKSNSNSGQSSLEIDIITNECNNLSTVEKDKKRAKQLIRCEALRDTSISPPPQNSESVENNCNSNMLTVVSSNSQSQIGPSLNSQSRKNKIKAQGSSGSLERSSPCLSRDSSTENYSDSTGTDLQQFLTDTLQKNKKDRMFLLKIEQELTQLVKETSKQSLKFPQMTSYNRMLVHRVAAFYGLDHNIDNHNGTSVVVTKTKNTRIPDMKFRDHIKDELLLYEPKKSILKRDSASLEDGSTQVSFDGKERSPDRQTGNLSDGSRSKSFEEREKHYEKTRARIFNQDSSSSIEGNEGNTHVISDCNGSNLLQRNSSLRSSQEDLPSNWTTDQFNDPRAWSSTDSDSSGRLQKNESKQTQQSVQLKAANSSDSDITPKSTTLSSSSSSCGMSLLTPDYNTIEINNSCNQSKNRPIVTKASSFGGISRNVDNNNSNNSSQNRLVKSGSLNVTQNATQPVIASNIVNSKPSVTPKTNVKPDNAHNSISNKMGSTHHQQQQQQQQQPPQHRFMASQQQTQQHISNASHSNRHSWNQNMHLRHKDQMTSVGNVVQWPPIIPQNYPQLLIQQQRDSNVNQPKETSYIQSGQQFYVNPNSNYGQQTINNEQQQHLTQQALRLVYPNQTQLQNYSSFGTLINNAVQASHHTIPSQVNQVPYQLQSSTSALNFPTNQSNIQNSNGFNQLMQSPPITHTYGAPLQVPSGIGTVWIINNGVQPNSSTPLMPCPPSNTPPTPPMASNIAPFVGMSYQQYRPTMNSAPNVNPNLGINAAQNRPQNHSLLKNQSLLTTQANTQQRILPSNGNHLMQAQEMVDFNLLCANNYVNRTSVVPNPQMCRRMPLNPNQALDVRLLGSQTSPFLLPTPQRPFFPLSNSVNVNHRSANINQRSKNSLAKNNRQQRNNTNVKNFLIPNTSSNGSNT